MNFSVKKGQEDDRVIRKKTEKKGRKNGCT